MKNVHTIDSQTVILHQQQNFVTLLQVSIQKVKGKVKKGQVNESKEMKTTKNQNRNEEKQAKRQQKQRKTKQNSNESYIVRETSEIDKQNYNNAFGLNRKRFSAYHHLCTTKH